jgi:two-component system cell cycle response regulator
LELKELLDNARRNEALLKRLQAFELQLLSAQHWQDFLTLLLEALPSQFDLDAVGLKVCDPDGELKASMLQSLDIDQGVMLNQIEFKASLSIVRAGAINPPPPWKSALQLPLMRGGEYLGQLYMYSLQHDRFQEGMATDFMQHLAAVIAACLVMVKQTESQALLALTDPLTGAENRRGFERVYKREWARGQRQHHVFSMILMDIDHFKKVNDIHGHGTGDRALKALCKTLKNVIRPTDHLGRLGGEEFAVLLPGCQPDQLITVSGRIQEAIREMVVLNDKQKQVPITASGSFISVTPRPHQNLQIEQVLDHLDKYLYQAKGNGRDQFINAST